jgi:hypothetical protein
MRLNARSEPEKDDQIFERDLTEINETNVDSGARAHRPLEAEAFKKEVPGTERSGASGPADDHKRALPRIRRRPRELQVQLVAGPRNHLFFR